MTREEAKKIIGELLLFGKAPCKKEELEDLCKVVLTALEQEPTTKNDLGVDCISRVDVLNNLANIAKVKAKSDAQKSLMGRCMFMVERMSSVTPQPCEDVISRQALLNATVNKNSIWNKTTDSKGENLETIISKLPSVTPQEPTGKNFTKADIEAIVKAINAHWELIIDEIRAEIQNGIHHFLDGEPIIEIKEVLQILDKYKAEQE